MKDCNSCGKCCIKYSDGGLSASKSEVEQWELFDPEIAVYVKRGEIWFDPKTGFAIERCPFLQHDPKAQRYNCSIYYARPEDCRIYPSTVQEMIIDGCEMIEVKDLSNLPLAQTTLDKLLR